MYKTCKMCKVTKPITKFHKSTTHKDGKRNECNYCQSVLNWFRRGKVNNLIIVNWSFKAPKIKEIVCYGCETRKPVGEYRNRSDVTSGIYLRCSPCLNKYIDKENKAKVYIAYYADKSEEIKQRVRDYRKANPHKIAELSAYRRFIERRSIPSWITKLDKQKMQLIYLERKNISEITGIEHHVDHIIPLNGVNVCGLHIPENLRVITATENLKKSNKLEGVK